MPSIRARRAGRAAKRPCGADVPGAVPGDAAVRPRERGEKGARRRAAFKCAVACAVLASLAWSLLPPDEPRTLAVDGAEVRPVAVKASPASSALGLLAADESDACLLAGTARIHCLGMRFPIDVVYLDEEGTVLFEETCGPGSVGSRIDGVDSVLELPAGEAGRFSIDVGDVVTAV